MLPDNITLIVSDDAEAAARACKEFLARRLQEAIAARGWASFAISGGSSPKALFQLLAREPLDWSKVHVFWVDERCVPADDAASNYGMAKRELLDPADVPEANVHRVKTELEPRQAAEAYAEEIRALLGAEAAFDVVHRGIGPDAHTASLFPGEQAILEDTGIAAALWVEKFAQWRVTLTAATLRRARATAVHAPGADKADALARIFEGPLDPLAVPAQVTARFGTAETWFVDPAAAVGLSIGA